MTPKRMNLVDQPMSLDAFITEAESDLRALQLPKPPLWHVAQDGVAMDRPEGLWLEFGTGSGTTARMLCEARKTGVVYTFDWFQGLPDDWGDRFKKGAFRFDPPTDLPHNGRLITGLFEDSLGPFLEEHPEPADLVHIDCDIYSSTKCVLNRLTDRLVPGTVMVFDEMLYYPGREDQEVKAFYEWLCDTGKSFEWIGIQGKEGAEYYYAKADRNPSRALEYFVTAESRVVRFDVPLNERVALRIT